MLLHILVVVNYKTNKEYIMNKSNFEQLVKSNWKLDPAHSRLGFSAKHMIIAEVEGLFRDFDINVDAGEGFADTEIEVRIRTASIDTGNSDRDNHLKSADFFDAENHPEIKFISTSLEKTDNEKFKLKGDLTIRGITKPIDLDVTFGGQIKDPWGNERVGFQVKGQLNRFDYGLRWNSLMETGGAIVGKTIKLNCRVELTKAE